MRKKIQCSKIYTDNIMEQHETLNQCEINTSLNIRYISDAKKKEIPINTVLVSTTQFFLPV